MNKNIFFSILGKKLAYWMIFNIQCLYIKCNLAGETKSMLRQFVKAEILRTLSFDTFQVFYFRHSEPVFLYMFIKIFFSKYCSHLQKNLPEVGIQFLLFSIFLGQLSGQMLNLKNIIVKFASNICFIEPVICSLSATQVYS